MQFELTPELADRIIFAMEDQHEEFMLDTETGNLLTVEEMEEMEAVEEQAEEKPGRYVPLPEWTPADGFRLMERFAEELRNPVYQEKLREALSGGRGVFRRFKDTIKEREELERRWYQFKEQAMQGVVADWYNDLRETWGLERVAVETAEIEDLVLSDFTIRRVGAAETALVDELRRAAEEQRREKLEPRLAVVAEAPAGEIAGAVTADAASASSDGEGLAAGGLIIDTLYVWPMFRGLGLGRLLLERVVEEARREGWGVIAMELSGRGLVLDDTATAMGFRTVAKRVSLDLS
ncbi:MAG: GNAT family N-acetyltransferase [Spirochaetes bacterium]|jgi:GNAT superfamily N-acetyltransferase|nr:GNAT family N-acetyltransferase [Spirochaetota bacterium]